MQKIAPGIYVPTVLPQYASTNSNRYISSYTDQRYQNWQTALELATKQYAVDLNSYEAKQKAQRDAVEAIDKDIDSIRKDIFRLQTGGLSVDEKIAFTKQAQKNQDWDKNVSATNAKARFDASESGKNARMSAYNRMPAGLDPTQADRHLTQALNLDNAEDGQAHILDSSYGEGTTKTGTAPNRQQKGFQILRHDDARASKAGLSTPAWLLTQSKKVQDTHAQALDDVRASGNSGGSSSDSTLTSSSYNTTGYSSPELTLEEEKAARDALIEQKLIELASLQDQQSNIASMNIPVPEQDIISTARDIYGSQFDRTLGYDKVQRQKESVNQLADYANRKMLEQQERFLTNKAVEYRDMMVDGFKQREAELSPDELAQAKYWAGMSSEEALDAYYSSLTPDAQAKLLRDAQVDAKAHVLAEIRRQAQDLTTRRPEPSMGMSQTGQQLKDTFTDSAKAVKQSVQDKAAKAIDSRLATKKASSIEMLAEELGLEMPVEDIQFEDSSASVSEEMPRLMLDEEVIYGNVPEEEIQFNDMSSEVSSPVKQPVVKVIPFEQGQSLKKTVAALFTGKDLVEKPKKMERLEKNTEWGRYVKDLVVTNNQATKPLTVKELEDLVRKEYTGRQADKAIELLYARTMKK